MFTKTFIINGLAAVASAHILMTQPVPYGKSSLNNSPLAADGSDFPCKQRSGVYDAQGASNVFKQGSTQQLAFQGTAVHGGGSCQVSVTTDAQPNKNSVWKVIKSIEGGCPAQGQAGNMGNSAEAPVPYKYDYTIPDELASGNYTLAWTWFNKIGNREMYMNCAPLTVTGSGGSESFLDTLPDMFTANIGNGCTTPDSKDVVFPNPGSEVQKLNGATDAFMMPTDASCQKPTGGSGGGSGGSNPTTTAPKPTDAPANEQPKPSNSAPGGIFITVPPSAAPASTQPATSAPAPIQTSVAGSPKEPGPSASSASPAPSSAPIASPVVNPGTGSGSGSGSGTGSVGAFSAGTACTSEGQWNCIGGSSFQRCASGAWSPVQAMSAGTTCQSGQSTNLNMVSKRSKHAKRHALRVLS